MSAGIIVIGGVFSMVSSICSASSFYACTDGTFDPDNFSANTCTSFFSSNCYKIDTQETCDDKEACQWDIFGDPQTCIRVKDSLSSEPGPACESNVVITGHSGSLGACLGVSNINPVQITFQGTYFDPRNPVSTVIHKYAPDSASNVNSYITAYQSEDNYCKMVKFNISEYNGECYYELKDAGYTDSPSNASTCVTSSEIETHWGSKNPQTVATTEEEAGYGIKEVSYNKYCP